MASRSDSSLTSRRRVLAAAAVFSLVFVMPTPVQASWQAMFVKVLAQINEVMDQFERYSGRLEDHLNNAAGVVGTYRRLYDDVRYLSNTREIRGIYDHMRADPLAVGLGITNDQRYTLEMYALGSARRWVHPCSAQHLVPCSTAGWQRREFSNLVYGSRTTGGWGSLRFLDPGDSGTYTRMGVPAAESASMLQRFANVWHQGSRIQRRAEWNIQRSRYNQARLAALMDGRRLTGRQLWSFSNRDIDDLSDGDDSFAPASGASLSNYVSHVHGAVAGDPCARLPAPSVLGGDVDTTLAAQITRMECAGWDSVDSADLLDPAGEHHMSPTELSTLGAALALHEATTTAQRLEAATLAYENDARDRANRMERELEQRRKRRRVLTCAGPDAHGLPHLTNALGGCDGVGVTFLTDGEFAASERAADALR